MCRFTNEMIGVKMAQCFIGMRVEQAKFIFVESLANDSIRLRLTILEFTKSFGREALMSAIVVASKADKCSVEKKGKRIAALKKIAQENSIPAVVEWQSQNIDEDGMQHQLETLRSALGSVPAAQTESLQTLSERVKARIDELFEEAPKTKQVIVEEEYLEAYKDKEEYDQEYIEWVAKEESYTEMVPYDEKQTRSEWQPYIEQGNTLGKVFTLGIGCRDKVQYERVESSCTVTKYKPETRYKTVQVPESRTRTALRDVIRHMKKVKMVEKTVTLDIDREQFRAQAVEEESKKMWEAVAGRQQ
eukprot:NODE_10372_length_1356_cov_13.825875.p1 GENE.NODE_10372_length_1356_cov_13.825875~~NODE_10372_length_1356_cov_13.825875.p1  ORF type:complete len:303 (-),score=69.20 NODE_10372_length_1356_cov_13.825875:311-1219(-)